MTTLFTVLGITFTAFCIWLTVRIVNRRERWAKWMLAAVITAAPFVYVLGVGPAQWLISREMLSDANRVQLLDFYSPLNSFYGIVPAPIKAGIDWYLDFWEP